MKKLFENWKNYLIGEKTDKPKVLEEAQFGQKEMPADASAKPVGAPPQRPPKEQLKWLDGQIANIRIPSVRSQRIKEREQLIADNPELAEEPEAQPE